jgi:hypothetical protein
MSFLGNLQDPLMKAAVLGAANFIFSFIGPAVIDMINMSDAEVGLVAQSAQDNKIGSSLYIMAIAFLTFMAAPFVGLNI